MIIYGHGKIKTGIKESRSFQTIFFFVSFRRKILRNRYFDDRISFRNFFYRKYRMHNIPAITFDDDVRLKFIPETLKKLAKT